MDYFFTQAFTDRWVAETAQYFIKQLADQRLIQERIERDGRD